MSFEYAEYAGKRKKTLNELFLFEMDQVVPWKADRPDRATLDKG
jgi:hypothetical protein